ncbi:hypothetical protein D9758_008024 [Tetrapyrgos nigripes]|uniref:Uncharacterized protein n=1 Tax=Tetrapyrgos nigripes TaxID=182062 RepID=A0A8H5D252_9AGAR|nr:hypothetical protein D9758_008024 [Tetrapyrgos nigripes]
MIPNELTSNDYLDISGKRNVDINYRNARCHRIHWECSSHPQPSTKIPFPEKTHGFFYYHLLQNAPLFAGGMRFRVCSSNDIRTFQDGHDLLRRNGFPWEISNWDFLLLEKYRSLSDKLVEAGAIHPGTLELCSTLASQAQLRHPPFNPIVYSLKQPFAMLIGKGLTRIWVADKKKLAPVQLRNDIIRPLIRKDTLEPEEVHAKRMSSSF